MKQILPVVLFSTMFLAGCSSSMNMTSHRRTNDIQTQQEQMIPIQDQKNILLGVQHDEEYLYITLAIGDKMKQRQVLFQGLTIWFDYQGGEERRFGIHYPITTGRLPFEGRRPDLDRMTDTSMIIPETLSDEIEILGPMDGEHHRLHKAEAKGIDATIEIHDGVMRYSLQVPLMDNKGYLYGIGTQIGKSIGMGIESGSFMPGGRGGGPRMGGGGEPGGAMAGRGGFGRRSGGRAPGDGQSRPDQIKFWTKVLLTDK